MKNRLLKCLLSVFFVISIFNPIFSFGKLDGGAEAIILDDKQALNSFIIPDKYLAENEDLLLPLSLNIYDNKNSLIYAVETFNTTITLPEKVLRATPFLIVLKIGEYTFTQKQP